MKSHTSVLYLYTLCFPPNYLSIILDIVSNELITEITLRQLFDHNGISNIFDTVLLTFRHK